MAAAGFFEDAGGGEFAVRDRRSAPIAAPPRPARPRENRRCGAARCSRRTIPSMPPRRARRRPAPRPRPRSARPTSTTIPATVSGPRYLTSSLSPAGSNAGLSASRARPRRPANRARPAPTNRSAQTRRRAGSTPRGENGRDRETRPPPREPPEKTPPPRSCRSSLSHPPAAHATVNTLPLSAILARRR